MPGHGRIQLAVVDQSTNYLNKMAEYISAGMETAIDITQDLVTNDADPTSPQVEELKEIMIDYCKMERDLKQFLQAMDDVKRESLTMDPSECSQLEKMLDTKIKQLAGENNDQELQDHDKYQDLMEKANSGAAEEEAEAAAETEMDSNTELAVTQQDIVTKCPFTGLEMVFPVKNTHCSHNYDRDGIHQFIKSRGKRAKCPVSGCVNAHPLVMADLEDNRELKRYIDKKNRGGGKRATKKK